MIKSIILCLLLFATSLNAAPNTLGRSFTNPGEWSIETSSLLPNPDSDSVSVRAPDGKTVVTLRGVEIIVRRNGKTLRGTENKGVLPLAELAWSPDSKAFFITWSEGGSVGNWLTYVYLIQKEQVRRINVVKEVKREFKKHYKCYEPEEPNIAGLKWIKDSRRLLLIGEVPPHSNCPEMGNIMGYIVSVPDGNIIEQISEQRVRSVWKKTLGRRLKR